MPIDRELVERFLSEVDAEMVPVIEAGANRLQGHRKLLGRYRFECAAWRSEKVDHVRGIMEVVNELCVARLILEDQDVISADYEPEIDGMDRTIDFLVRPATTDARIFYDVKTIHPQERDAWERYQKAKDERWFTPNTELVLDREWMGGEIAHELFASREKFLQYALELEAKIRQVANREGAYFRVVFCGNGFQWRRDHLEDFADFYFTGRYRPDDSLGAIQAHYMNENGITLDRSIHGFCYLQRAKPSVTVAAFACDVRGPRLPF